MAHPVCEVLLTENALNLPALAHSAETGAVIDFWGVVRESEDGAKISGIEYEAHRAMAEHQLREIVREGAERFELRQITVQHRVGFVAVGEASLLVRVGGKHRAEAFRASQWIVDELKKRAPIWKHPRAVLPNESSRSSAAVAR
ncbi:MAG: molybdenum cofactor biosynthesis protein MoaE [Verrucomicrobiota bacterium]|nr:molybdenum cofactor biosynthesis protein MoaE [Verrucomicrobiota bacterium]